MSLRTSIRTLYTTLRRIAAAAGFRPHGILPDWEISRLCTVRRNFLHSLIQSPDHSHSPQEWEIENSRPMLWPFSQKTRQFGVSSGLSYFGYDIRLGSCFKTLKTKTTIDMEKINEVEYLTWDTDYFVLQPNQTVLCNSLEYFRVPNDIMITFIGKSTIARLFVETLITPAEPGWEGYLTIEIVNHGPTAIKLYSGQGIAQAIFHRGAQPATQYAGKYQKQSKTQTAISD